ncbi:MAG TPA: ParM/StbA family protein [archaeon]|nr:ParM/StbA family protein [archaeon]
MEYLGIDVGFGYTKAYDGERSVIIKSVIGDAAEIQFQSGFSEGGMLENLHVTIDEKQYYLGDLAEKQSNLREFTLDQNTLVESFAKVFALSMASFFAGPKPLECSVVTGLPIRFFKQYRARYTSMLEGTHRVLLHNRGEVQEKILTFKKVRVLPQPFGAVFSLLMNNHGRIIDRDVARDKFGIIDIGFRTTDYTITDRLRYIERGSRTTDTGISKAFGVISKKILEQSGINVELYRLFEPVRKGRIRIHGKEYSLTELRDEVMKQLANAIVSDMERLWADDWDLEFVLLSGGGSSDLAPILEKMIEGQIKLASVETDMRMANVIGYLKYAKYMDLMDKRRYASENEAPEKEIEEKEEKEEPAS